MDLKDAVHLLKTEGNQPLTEAGAKAARMLLEYLDVAFLLIDPNRCWALPRDYYIDITGAGYEQLCFPVAVNSEEHAWQLLARDVADGFLEEVCEFLGPDAGGKMWLELGLSP